MSSPNVGQAADQPKVTDEPEVCLGCGQALFSTPDDPMTTLWCDTCLGGVK